MIKQSGQEDKHRRHCIRNCQVFCGGFPVLSHQAFSANSPIICYGFSHRRLWIPQASAWSIDEICQVVGLGNRISRVQNILYENGSSLLLFVGKCYLVEVGSYYYRTQINRRFCFWATHGGGNASFRSV